MTHKLVRTRLRLLLALLLSGSVTIAAPACRSRAIGVLISLPLGSQRLMSFGDDALEGCVVGVRETRATVGLEHLERLDVVLSQAFLDDKLGVSRHVGDVVAVAQQLHDVGNFRILFAWNSKSPQAEGLQRAFLLFRELGFGASAITRAAIVHRCCCRCCRRCRCCLGTGSLTCTGFQPCPASTT